MSPTSAPAKTSKHLLNSVWARPPMKEPTTETHPLDEDRDPASAAFVRGLAAEVAAQYGGDPNPMRRARGDSNATPGGDGVAARVPHPPPGIAPGGAPPRAPPHQGGP